jgi:MYXO-CTERM domain-containing protein
MKKLLSMCAALALCSSLAIAQSSQPAPTTDARSNTVTDNRQDTRHDRNWGWLGLLGLVGLAGLRRRTTPQDRTHEKPGDLRRVA